MLKKIHILLTAGLFLSEMSFAQNIPNPGFETWTSGGNYEDPQGWGTLNSQTAILGIKTVTKATAAADVHGGTYAIRLVTAHIGVPYNMNIPGLAATGTINASTKAIDGGFSYSKRPVSLSGWYKYSPAGKDTASVEITLSRWDTLSKTRVTVGHAKFLDTATVTAYTSFTIPLNYTGAALPDTGMIVLLSSQQNSSVVNSTLFIDDLTFNLPAGIQEDILNERILVYPNPAGKQISIGNLPSGISRFRIFDGNGKIVLDTQVMGPLSEISLPNLSAGLYLYEIMGSDLAPRKQGKLIISNP